MGEVTVYVDSLEGPDREAVRRVFDRARALVPEAEEGRGYGMPALRYRGKPLLAVHAAKGHLGIYPFSPEAVEAVASDLEGFSLSKGTIRFSAEQPVPDEVLDRLVEARRAQIDGG
ncbi:hypothetical protein ARHIZOSPH14_10160 [Agromyces rhizosphaerae]|uniref:YdhG-like domain-containing protein n=1 Tax=Agromyces rhizosphaerae TaxID=88374 RepID=A0A9W6FNA8_9MICO|nr:DUF1801 domain-containing protein [Agromyces rhizosphaerae]GLI26774.1 hypothetical protein ARHIZOSPH14_10160 [Agromyces rhizosphaerae]